MERETLETMNNDSPSPRSILLPSSPPLSPYQEPHASDDVDVEQNSALNDYDSSSLLPTLHVQQHDDSADDSGIHDDRDYADEFDGDLPNQTAVEEREMHMKLLDMESSFLPEPSTIGIGRAHGGADDTYLVGVNATDPDLRLKIDEQNAPALPATPKEGYKRSSLDRITEADSSLMEDTSEVQNIQAVPYTTTPVNAPNTSALETMSSSPTAEAAARTVSRVVSSTLSGAGAPEEIQESHRLTPDLGRRQSPLQQEELDATPRRSQNQTRDISPTRSASQHNEAHSAASTTSERRRIRPKYLISRQSSHRLSASSIATANTDAALSDANMGLDYALQSGGAVPMNSDKSSQNIGRPKAELARSTSLGSMASGVSALSDENPFDRRAFSGVSDASLHTLDEEEPAPQTRPTSSGTETKREDDTVPLTPKAKAAEPEFPPDSVATQRIRDAPASSTITRQFRGSNINASPDKRPHPTPGFGRGRNMTLKEQSSTIDRLSKENFDLKMRIHFLNQALSKRSEEGVKEMISENVELKSGKLKLQKDNQALRRTIRDLERQLKDKGENESNQGDARGSEADDERRAMDEEELLYLRERTESYEIEIERLRTENVTKESDKRRLAEMVKALGDGRGPTPSDMGVREERDMWKDMLEAETAAREQVEEENRRLREEMFHIRGDSASSDTYHPRSSRRSMRHSAMSRPGSDNERSIGRTTTTSTTLVEIELLKQENAELRREVSAQTSMLTSRNREKERLYQEIEDLKLQRRGDGSRPTTGDSIFERSASRVHGRSASRASDGTRSSHLSDMERDTLETKNGELRDLVSTLKLENQALRADLDEYAAEVERVEREYQGEIEGLEEHLQHLQLERNHAVQLAEGREEELQELKDEAQEELDAIGDELEMKHDECQRLEAEVQNQQENLRALQAEVRSANEGIIRLEEDAQNNLQKYRSVQEELDDANRELESMEKELFEANSKVQRLTVQQESSQNEIAFLREEQDADKIKIGDMESELRMTHTGLQNEREKTKELDMRLAEERHQREVVGGKEKQEVQRIMNDLNREASGSKDEIRKLKKSLSAREIEASTWKSRLVELENNLRETLGDLSGTRSSLLTSITNLQKELESTTLELETLRHKLDEKESLLRNRDALLESHGLETRKLADLLERERQAHRADKHSFEQSLKSHQQASRTIAQNNSRISDLENARGHDRKRFNSAEQQFKDQLNERNAMFLNLWKRLSAICGPDWTHSNSLINGNLPSQEVIGNMLFWPGFSRNLLLAIKTVESIVNGFKTRIRAVEHNLTKEYQNLEHSYGLRVKKLDRLEDMVQQMWSNRRPLSSNAATAEISKLRGENRLLKAELNLIQPQSRSRAPNTPARAGADVTSPNPRSDRSNSSVSKASSHIPQPSSFSSATTLVQTAGSTAGTVVQSQSNNNEPSQAQWIQRLRELERRLKAEREARLLDRSGARKRLEERNVENEQLRAALERERINRGNPSAGDGGGMGGYDHGAGYGDDQGDGRHRSEAVQRVSSTRQSKQGRETHSRENETDQRGEFVVIDHVFEDDDDDQHGHHHQHRRHLRHRNEPHSGEDSDSYDGEIDDYDDDDGTGTGTDDGGGLCVEVEV